MSGDCAHFRAPVYKSGALIAPVTSARKRAARAPILVGDLEIDPSARTARVGSKPVDLTTVEFDLLETLADEAGQAISRESLVQRVLGREFSPFDRSVDTHVYNLRRKLGPLPGGGDRIVGIRGVGYLIAEDKQ